MGRRINIYMPVDLYLKWKNEKSSVEKEISSYAGKPVKLTMPKFMNAILVKHKSISGLIPFNKKHLFQLSKKKRGEYEL